MYELERISLTVRRGQRDLAITPRRISVALNSCRKPATSYTQLKNKQSLVNIQTCNYMIHILLCMCAFAGTF